MKIVSDHGFPKDGADAFELFANERDYIKQTSKNATTVAAMDWAHGEITRLRALAARQEWQDISTAPKEGGYIVTNRKRQVAFCDVQCGHRIIHNVAGFLEWDFNEPATLWRALPQAPGERK